MINTESLASEEVRARSYIYKRIMSAALYLNIILQYHFDA